MGLNWARNKRNQKMAEDRRAEAYDAAVARGQRIMSNLQERDRKALAKANRKRKEGAWEWGAKPKMLDDGSWGALVEQTNVHKGDRLFITTKAGKKWTTAVKNIVFQGKGITICQVH